MDEESFKEEIRIEKGRKLKREMDQKSFKEERRIENENERRREREKDETPFRRK